ncbi:putative HSP40/DnaJ peptide-binding protein [Rosa chinensis]|uniref:Putative HSP40/DnaJ peptide-binding protein n=1 Tax=Rosa chinensis TaxID=74649 RepID=A0A2P6RVV7_ROSCH|nr:putative HSP40/DnaJ peptide-binding protein [Rosa chinensis]
MRTEQTPIGLFSQEKQFLHVWIVVEMVKVFLNTVGSAGEGRVHVKISIKVQIPPRVSRGSILRVAGEGGAGPRGGPPGDLYVYLDVEEVEGI